MLKKYTLGVLIVFLAGMAVAAWGQQPQSQAPLYATNAKYTNGVAPGYMPCGNAGLNCQSTTGLNLLIGPGTANCSGTIIQYAGGTKTLTASSTNYIYLNTASSCAVSVKTTGFTSSDIPIAEAITNGSGIVTLTDVRTIFNTPGNSSPGVTSINSQTGSFIFNGSGISCSGSNPVICTVTGGGGGGGSLIPSNAHFIYTGTSYNDDDNNDLSLPVTISSWSTSGTTVTMNFSSAHNLHVNDWFSLRFAEVAQGGQWPNIPNPSYNTVATGYSLFQVVSAPSSTQITFNAPLVASGTCSSSCGTMYSAMGYFPFTTSAQMVFPANALNNTSVYLPPGVTINSLNTGFSAMFGSICPVSVPTYLIINNFNNDIWSGTGRTASQIETDYYGVFSQAHTCGMTVVVGTALAQNQNQTFVTQGYTQWYLAQQWLRAQGKSQANPTQLAAGQYWDIGADLGSDLNDPHNAYMFNQSNGGLVAAGVQHMAADIANAMASGSGLMMPDANTTWFGTVGDGSSNVANGIVYTPHADTSFEFQWTNSAVTKRIMSLGQPNSGRPILLTVGEDTTVPGRITALGDAGTANTFDPILQSIDLEPNPFNSFVKNFVVGDPITPNATLNRNNIIETIAAIGATNGNAPTIATGQGADIGFSYNSSGTPSLNELFMLFAGDTNDAMHITQGPVVCIDIASAEGNSPQEGCPTGATYAFGVGGSGSTPPPFRSDASGNIVVASCTGCGSGSIANITISVTGAVQGANSCSSPATATMTGVTTSGAGSHVTAAFSANPASLTGWGSTGGMVFDVWPSASNQVSWIVCNQTGSSITFSSISFSIGAQ